MEDAVFIRWNTSVTTSAHSDPGSGDIDKWSNDIDEGPEGADEGPEGADNGPEGADEGPEDIDEGPEVIWLNIAPINGEHTSITLVHMERHPLYHLTQSFSEVLRPMQSQITSNPRLNRDLARAYTSLGGGRGFSGDGRGPHASSAYNKRTVCPVPGVVISLGGDGSPVKIKDGYRNLPKFSISKIFVFTCRTPQLCKQFSYDLIIKIFYTKKWYVIILTRISLNLCTTVIKPSLGFLEYLHCRV